jgi:hypothetical protein
MRLGADVAAEGARPLAVRASTAAVTAHSLIIEVLLEVATKVCV